MSRGGLSSLGPRAFDLTSSLGLIASSSRAGRGLSEGCNDDVSANKPRRCCSALLPSRSQLCSRLPTQRRRCVLPAHVAFEQKLPVHRLTALACCRRKHWLWKQRERQYRQLQRRQALTQLRADFLRCDLSAKPLGLFPVACVNTRLHLILADSGSCLQGAETWETTMLDQATTAVSFRYLASSLWQAELSEWNGRCNTMLPGRKQQLLCPAWRSCMLDLLRVPVSACSSLQLPLSWSQTCN